MDLTFTKTAEGYVAEFQATGPFNLHLEREKQGLLKIQQRGCSEGEYAESFSRAGTYAPAVFDYDFGALVFPKYIKVISGVEVAKCVVTYSE